MQPSNNSTRSKLTLVVALASFWLLMSGHYTPLLLALGGLSIAATVYFSSKMAVVDAEGVSAQFRLKLVTYTFWLLNEIRVCNILVVKQILAPQRFPTKPACQHLATAPLSSVGQVLYANSITLTPGTVTIDIKGDELLVHALHQDSIDDLAAGDMLRRVAAVDR